MTTLPPEAPRPRLCQIRKDYPDEEYGFNLLADHDGGQYVGAIDPESPALLAGLRNGDRIIAVNGKTILGDLHLQVVAKIKEQPLQCTLLVIDENGQTWYRERRLPLPIHGFENEYSTTNDEEIQMGHHGDVTLFNGTPTSGSGNILRPRLCRLVRSDGDVEYGFNLHAERNNGHFIGKLDSGSVAEKAGLEEGQRIVGVNGILIYPSTPNRELVEIIKSDPCSADLLVASPEIDHWYRKHKKEYDFRDCEVFEPVIGNVLEVPSIAVAQSEVLTNDSSHFVPETLVPEKQHQDESLASSISQAPAKVTITKFPVEFVIAEPGPKVKFMPQNCNKHDEIPIPTLSSSIDKSGGPQGSRQQDWMNLTASELRDRISRHKKHDPRTQPLSLSQKYEIVHNL